MSSKHLLFNRIDLNPFIDSLKVLGTFSLYKTLNFLTPTKGRKGHLCPRFNILGKLCNIDAPFGTSDRRLLTFE